jgi:hypothetical protein
MLMILVKKNPLQKRPFGGLKMTQRDGVGCKDESS